MKTIKDYYLLGRNYTLFFYKTYFFKSVEHVVVIFLGIPIEKTDLKIAHFHYYCYSFRPNTVISN